VDKSCACQICGKHFSTVNAYNNHLKSKKHREADAMNERKRKDGTYSNNQFHCSLEAASSSCEMGASGDVAEEHQLQKDIGTTSIITMIYLVSINQQFNLMYYYYYYCLQCFHTVGSAAGASIL